MTSKDKPTTPTKAKQGLWTASEAQSKALDAEEIGTIGFTSYVNRNLPNAVDYIGQSADCPNFIAALTLCRAWIVGVREAAGITFNN